MDERRLERLRAAAAEVFPGTPVLFAYLFGSEATGRTHPRSDVDVAVYLDETAAPERYLDLSLRLAGGLESASGVGNVEALLILNEAPLPLRGRVVGEGIVIYSRDEPARVRYESLTMRMFLDFEIHAGPLDEKVLRDMAEGRR